MSEREILSYNFDRLGWLQRTEYLTRRALFLDLNHWIKLSEERDDVYRNLSRALQEAVDAGTLICPVSPSLLMEVAKRPQSERRYRYCLLMDQLSRRLSLRLDPIIFAQEFRARILEHQIERQVAYSFFLDAVSAGSSLEFPKDWSTGLAQQAARLTFDRITSVSIPVFMNMLTNERRERHIGYLRAGWSNLARQAGEWREKNQQVSAAEIERAEFASTVDALFPYATRFLLEEANPSVLRALGSMSTMSEDEKRELLRTCPTFWSTYKLAAALRSHRKIVKENDLWDLQHVASAAPYVDCLACDGGTRHISTQLARLDDKYGIEIVSKPDEIMAWVCG